MPVLHFRFELASIKNEAYFFFSKQLREDYLLLPKLYVALAHLTGPGDSCYDDYKGSYSFVFELEVQKDANKSRYLYHIYHYRSYIEFSVRHVVDKNDPRDDRIYHQPDDALLSDLDICAFSSFFCNYSLGYMKGTQHKPEPFVKCSDSNLFLFGYSENEYFRSDYEDCDQYRKEKALLESGLLSTVTVIE